MYLSVWRVHHWSNILLKHAHGQTVSWRYLAFSEASPFRDQLNGVMHISGLKGSIYALYDQVHQPGIVHSLHLWILLFFSNCWPGIDMTLTSVQDSQQIDHCYSSLVPLLHQGQLIDMALSAAWEVDDCRHLQSFYNIVHVPRCMSASWEVPCRSIPREYQRLHASLKLQIHWTCKKAS